MVTPVWLALVVIALFAIPTWLCVWSRRDTWARPAAVVLFLVAIPVVAWAGVETLGRHKPVDFAWLAAGEYLALAAVMHQDEAIYVYIIDPERKEPRPIVLPWRNETAQAIQDAMDGAPDGREGEFVIRVAPDRQETEITAHPLPQPPQPPEKENPDPGLTYQQED